MRVQKKYIIILFTCLLIPSVQADVREDRFTSYNLFNNNILSGEKRRIEYTVDNWVSFLIGGKGGKKLYPSKLKTEHDVNQFLQLLRAAGNEKTNSVLISIANIYISSAEEMYRQIFRNSPVYQSVSFSALYDLSLFFDYSVERDRMLVMMRQWYMGLVFLSLAGFSSSHAKGLYIATIERVQDVYNFFSEVTNQTKSMSHDAYKRRFSTASFDPSVFINELFNSVIDFNNSFNRLHVIYSKFILPSFIRLSWVRHDVLNSDHPEVQFRYGRILHKAYGSNNSGLSYISNAADQGYLPAIKYLGEHYLRQKGGVYYQAGEGLMMKYLEGHLHPIEKLGVIRGLFHSNVEKGENVMDSFQRGFASLRRSCLAAFRSNRLNDSE